jgi:regulation of enolase protein 1 (concanavalin A-like superfamily)
LIEVRTPPDLFCRNLLLTASFIVSFVGSARGQTLPAPWSARDIGSPTLSGSASHASGVFSVDAAGVDIWGSSDQFHFVSQAVSGDVDVRARIDGLTPTHRWAKAGVMIRSALTASAAHGFALVTPGMGLAFQRRVQAGAQSLHTAGDAVTAPIWVRLVRQGSRVTAYASRDGQAWVQIGAETIALGATAYVGIAVTSHDASIRTTADVSNVRVTTLALPNGQASADIGSPTIAGSATYAGGTYTIKAAGTDIWNSADQFHYVYQQMNDDGEVLARIASLGYTHQWAKAGVMIRETLAADSPHAFALVSAAQGYAFQRRLDSGTSSINTAGGSGGAPGWVRLVRAGQMLTAFRSADGVNWTVIGSDAVTMTGTVYVGIAVTSHNVSAATTAVVDSLTVRQSGTPVNQPPLVSLTAPAQGAQFTAPATIALAASASDPEGRLMGVRFYAGTTLLATDTSAPYSFSWSAVPAGTYSLTAVAEDADGASATSAAVSIAVIAAVSPPRYVVFTASSDHATSAVTGYRLEIFASGANPATAVPLAISDLGKPTPAANGDITVDRSTFFTGLASGSYVATVSAVGPGGIGRSAPVTFTR